MQVLFCKCWWRKCKKPRADFLLCFPLDVTASLCSNVIHLLVSSFTQSEREKWERENSAHAGSVSGFHSFHIVSLTANTFCLLWAEEKRGDSRSPWASRGMDSKIFYAEWKRQTEERSIKRWTERQTISQKYKPWLNPDCLQSGIFPWTQHVQRWNKNRTVFLSWRYMSDNQS